MTEIDWSVLMPAIKNKRCVLFLGPDAYPFDEKQTVEDAMWSTTTTDAAIIRKYYDDDGLVLFQKKSKRLDFMEKLRAFYNDPAADWSLTHLQLQKLVHLPFLAIVNLTFDDLLVQNFQEAGLDYEKINYIFRQSMDDKLDRKMSLSKEKPLILNLLGNISSPDNLVLTHNDLFDFLKTLFENKDEWLQELLHEADCFLFIGVPFEKWYMQLLLQKLSKYTKQSDEAERYALSENKPVRMKDLYKQELKIQFVEEAHSDVIEKLYKYCEDNNILNKPIAAFRAYKNPELQKFYRFLLRGDIKSCINNFLTWTNTQAIPNKNLTEGLTIVSANFNNLEGDADTMSFQELKMERNKIIKALLYFLDQANER